MKHRQRLFIIGIALLNILSLKASSANAVIKNQIRAANFTEDSLTKKDVLNRIKKVAAKQFERKAETMTMKTSFVKDFKADDLDMVELVMAFEEEFKIKIPDDQLETLTTVQKAYDYITKVMNLKK